MLDLHVNERLPDFSVDRAEKAEGHGELKQKSIYHHLD